MIEAISELPRDIAVLMIEHDMNVVFSVADRITVLSFGEVIASGTVAEIRANDRVREVYLGGGRIDSRARIVNAPITTTALCCVTRAKGAIGDFGRAWQRLYWQRSRG